VARSANVSVPTVCRGLNRSAAVSPKLESRGFKAAAKIGIGHRRNRTGMIAFLLGNRSMLHPIHSRILVGAEACCAEHKYHLLFMPLNYPSTVHWRHLQVPELLRRRDMVDGFIVAGTNSQNLLDHLTNNQLPFAVLGNNVVGDWQSEKYDTVWFDLTGGAYH